MYGVPSLRRVCCTGPHIYLSIQEPTAVKLTGGEGRNGGVHPVLRIEHLHWVVAVL